MRILCADEECSSRDRPDPLDLTGILIKGPSAYYCPYCRSFRFVLATDEESK